MSSLSNLWPASLRWRLQLWLAFLLTVLLGAFGIAVFQWQRITLAQELDAELERRVNTLSLNVRNAAPPSSPGRPPDFSQPPPGPPPGPPPDGEPPEDNGPAIEIQLSPATAALFDGSPYYFAIWGRHGAILRASANAPESLPPPDPLQRDTLTRWRTRDGFRESFHCSSFGDCVLTGTISSAQDAALSAIAWKLLAVGLSILALGLGGGWWVTTRAIRPMERIGAAAERISLGNLSERIVSGEEGSELAKLAGILNSTFDRLESAFLKQRQFTADAAHELRTPLAVIIAETQTTLARERSAADYRQSVEVCLEAAQQMRKLTEALLELSRFDEHRVERPSQRIELLPIAENVVNRLRPLAAERDVRLDVRGESSAAWANPELTDRIIENLAGNAIAYNRPGGSVRVDVRAAGAWAQISVTDTGIGIAPEHLSRIFDRFYRVDRVRALSAGHNGLGLSICKAMVELQGGQIEVQSTLDAGSCFRVRLPQSDRK